MNDLINAPFNEYRSKDERTWGMLCHILSLAGLVIPLGSVIGPLVMWLIKKEESHFVDTQGKESLNFQLTILVAVLMCIPLAFIIIGIPIAILLSILSIVFPIMGGIKANEGKNYKYPYSIKFIR